MVRVRVRRQKYVMGYIRVRVRIGGLGFRLGLG